MPVCPAVITTSWGDLLVLEKTLSWQRAEEIVEGISTYSGGLAGGPLAVKGKVLKKAAIPGSISFTIKLGTAIKTALDSGDDAVEAMIDASDGQIYKIFEGEVVSHLFEERLSFIWGYNILKGVDSWKGHRMKIWYKNENHLSWIDNKPYVTSPDGINIIDPVTGWGLSNYWLSQWEYGKRVTVIGVRSEDIWRTEKGLKLMGSIHFGSDITYKPIEKIIV